MSRGQMQPIQYKVPVFTKTASGGKTESYTPGAKDWAEVRSLNQSFQNVGLQQMDGQQVQFKIRYRRSLEIKATWLILYEGREYKILSIEREKLQYDNYVVVGKAIR